MKRFAIILAVLVAGAAAAAFYLFRDELLRRPAAVDSVRYDVDADGEIELVRWSIDGRMALWRWDRDNDGAAELSAYDVTADAQGQLTPAGRIVAWDWGADGIIDEGQVPDGVQRLLRTPEIASALAASPTGELALVGREIQGLVDQIRAGYDEWRLDGFRMPIVGAKLPARDSLLPGAPRAYRNGIHQGFDMVPGQIGAPTGYNGPVVAAKDGVVIRADVDYVEMTPAEHAQALATAEAAGTTPPDVLDRLRGRQIWIDHGAGIVTRYCHLAGVVAGLTEGQEVEAGEVIGFVGNTGMEAGVNGTRANAHLHFELRIDDRYLGEGLSAEQLRERAGEILGVGSAGS